MPTIVALSVADFVLERLRAWGVHRVFGYPGDGINGLLGALDRAGGDPELIQVRHEEMSAFMACGHAKFTGKLGVCLATSGPGAVHLLNGLYDAKLDGAPVLALVGQQKRLSLGASYQQEVDLPVLFADVCEYVQTCMVASQARHLVDRAVRIAIEQRGVTALVFPNDVQELDAVPSPPREHGVVYSSVGFSRPRVCPRDEDLARAADVLNSGSRVALLVGQGAREAADEVAQAAELLGAGVAKALLGKDVLPDDLSFVTGAIGLLGTRPSYELMRDCDTLLMIGSRFPYAEWLPREGQARGVQIDLDGRMLGMRYPMEVHLVGDARDTLRGLVPLLERKNDLRWSERIAESIERWRRTLHERAAVGGDPINPQLVAYELSPRLPDRCILTADSGSSTVWYAQQIQIRAGMRASLSGTLASMGSAVPYAIAAKLAHPDRPVVALVGDGAMQMNGLNELITLAKYRDRWSDPTFVICVFNNRDLNMVTWEQRVLSGDPKYPASQTIPDFPYARLAELVGLRGIRVERPEHVAAAIEEALGAGEPAVLEAVVDPEIPPLPPHITVEQATNLAKALVKGDPEGLGIAKKSVAAKLGEFVRR
jgi:pyruvate dehydrogenase (quinone)